MAEKVRVYRCAGCGAWLDPEDVAGGNPEAVQESLRSLRHAVELASVLELGSVTREREDLT